MNALQEVIQIMTLEDVAAFRDYLAAKNKRKDVVNTKLFELLRTDDTTGIEKLYTGKNKDAYHAVRKRLYDSLVEFMANRSFENDTSQEHEVLRLLVVGRVFLEHGLNKAAFKCLAQAEDKALHLEQFSLLSEIYHTRIQYAHLDIQTPLEALIAKFTRNKQKMDMEERLNLAYAVLRRELTEIYHQGKVVDFQQLVTTTIASFNISLQEALTFKSLYRILFIANEYASLNSDYVTIEPFVIKSYNLIAHNEEKAGRNLYYHIYILYFMANSCFRNRRFALSEEYLEKMHQQLHLQGKKYYSRFILRHALLLALNKNYSGQPGAAVSVAEKALVQNSKLNIIDVNDLRLSLTVFLIQQEDNKAAHKQFKELGHTDGWYEKKMGTDWAIKKNLVEILLHVNLQNIDLAISRTGSFRRRYKSYLLRVKEERVLAYVTLVEKYINKPEAASSDTFRKGFDASFASFNSGKEDIFVLSFLAWLLSKIERKPLYEVTLQLIR
jgi:hypothetical protein